jgi:pimeloyl-ACP methyl ester carboxylesterase
MKEIYARLETVRPGRTLFVRQVSMGQENSATRLQLVCVHGLCGTERHFLPFLHALDHAVASNNIWLQSISYDWMGCGKSPLIPSFDAYHNRETEADLLAVLQRLDSSVPTVVLAHSYGPSIVAQVLPQITSQLRLVGIVWVSTALKSDTITFLADGGPPLMKLPTFVLRCMQPSLTNSFVQAAVLDSHTDVQTVVRNDSNANDMWVAKCYHRHTCWAHVDLVQNLPIDHLVLHGAEDGLLPITAGQDLANRLGTELIAIDQASHMLMLEQPTKMATAVAAFLSQRFAAPTAGSVPTSAA